MKLLNLTVARFWLADRGSIAVIAALVLPVVMVGAVAAITLQEVSSFHAKTADVADSAALFGAQQLGFNPNGANERTEAWARAQLTDNGLGKVVNIQATEVDSKTILVTIDGNVPSFFGNMLPAGGFATHAQSTAQAVNSAPLCVLVFGSNNKSYYQTQKQNLNIDGQGLVTASGCAVYSDQDINAGGSGTSLTAADVEAVGKAHGGISPTPLVDAAYVSDPFSSVNVTFPSSCPQGGQQNTVITTNTTLPPGLHCDHMTVEDGATLTLLPGEHYFSGNLTLQDTSQLIGADVVLDFDKDSKFDFNGSSVVSLDGRKSGSLAGFVIVCNRTNDHDFSIESDHVSKLVGTVYIPMAQLVIDGKDKVAQSSPWTVIVAQAVHVQGSSNLVINSDYASSTVPVPTGVGPTNHGAKLIQ